MKRSTKTVSWWACSDAVRGVMLGAALATVAGCGGDGTPHHLPPQTTIDEAPAALTNQSHVRITFYTSGAGRFLCQLDGATASGCSSPFEADVSDGVHRFQVSAVVNNVADDSPAEVTWKVDTVPPDTTIVTGPPALDSALAPAFTFQGTDDQGAVTFECALDGGAFAACTSPATVTVVDGMHHYQVRAIDAAGNIDSTPADATWTVDSTPPDTAITSGPAADGTTAASVRFEFNSPDSTATFECKLDDAAFTACTSPQAFTLAGGSHTFAVRAKDPVGLVDPSPATRTWTVDTMAPGVTVTAVTTPTSNNRPSVTFTVTGATTIQCQVDTGAFTACTSPFIPAAALADGSHTVTIRGTDAVGNVGTGATTFTVDTTPPVVTVTAVTTPTNNNRPSVTFTVTGATTIQCQVDTGAFAACTSPFTPAAALADGSHTVTVRGTDAAGNVGTGATTFTVDTTPPGVAFDDAPPALWPVNYFDMKFHTTDASATLACSLNGGGFAACTSPHTITTIYNATSTFAVRATDRAGNTSTVTRSWTSRNGLVLHYPWEQGDTENTSLLTQNLAYSPDGSTALDSVGGWAGTAASSPVAHQYPDTIRALSSSADGTYTVSIWVRAGDNPSGTVLSTLATNNGFALSISGHTVRLQVKDAGTVLTTDPLLMPLNQWVQLGVLATTTANGPSVQLLINGTVASTLTPRTTNGFGPGQAANLTVGPIGDADLDDLRFYNRALTASELCTTLVRGQLVGSSCVPLIPGLELSFETDPVRDTGNWALTFTGLPESQFMFVDTGLGTGMRLTTGIDTRGYTVGFASRVAQAPGHSFSFWFDPTTNSDDSELTLIDFRDTNMAVSCGIEVRAGLTSMRLLVGDGSIQGREISLPISSSLHNLLVTEQKMPGSTITQSLSIYLDGVRTVMPIGNANVYSCVADQFLLANDQGTVLDEIQFWPRDLSADPEMLCENGLDGEWDPVTSTCDPFIN